MLTVSVDRVLHGMMQYLENQQLNPIMQPASGSDKLTSEFSKGNNSTTMEEPGSDELTPESSKGNNSTTKGNGLLLFLSSRFVRKKARRIE